MPSIALEKSSPQGLLQRAFTQRNGHWVMVKNTNAFDQSETDIGIFKVTNETQFSETNKRLGELHQGLLKYEKALPKGLEESNAGPHDTYLKLGKFKLEKSHPFYKKVKAVYDAMVFNSKLEQESGVKLIKENGLKITNYKASTNSATKDFNYKFKCQAAEAEYICPFENLGVLFLKSP